MSFLNRSGGRSAASVVAVFDIGSGSVGAALVNVSRSKLPHVIWNTRVPISFQEILDFDQLTKAMLSTLLDIALELQSKGMPLLKKAGGPTHLADVMFVFASPWYSMQAKVFKIDKEEPFELTPQFIKNLIKHEEQEFQKAHANKEARSKKEKEKTEPMLIEQKIVQTTLNGYIVSNPFGKSVTHAQIDLVLSAIPPFIHEKALEIKNQLMKGHGEGTFHSFILPAFIVTRDIFHGNKSFLLMDVSAEVTDIATVHKGTIIDATSFPYGKHFIIREVAARSNTVPEEAVSMLRTYMAGDSTVEQAERLRNILLDIQKVWLESFVETVGKIAAEVPLPKNVYLAADNDYEQWFKQAIGAGDFSEFALSKAPFKVTILNAKALEKYCVHSRLTTSIDPFLSIEAVYLRKALYEE